MPAGQGGPYRSVMVARLGAQLWLDLKVIAQDFEGHDLLLQDRDRTQLGWSTWLQVACGVGREFRS